MSRLYIQLIECGTLHSFPLFNETYLQRLNEEPVQELFYIILKEKIVVQFLHLVGIKFKPLAIRLI